LFPDEILRSHTGSDKFKTQQHLIIIVNMMKIMKKGNAIVKTEAPQYKANYPGIWMILCL
jgi:hypothetical protein